METIFDRCKGALRQYFLVVAILFVGATSAFAQVMPMVRMEHAGPKKGKDGVVRLLAIGNSFSEDAIEHYLYGLAKEAGHKIIIGNLYIGGASLELHWKNAGGDISAYEYRKVGLDGNKERLPKTSIAKALTDEPWDYISFQQASPLSGQYASFTTPLPLLFQYVKSRVSNPNTQYVFHQTWAYAQNSTHNGFANYNKDQKQMYTAIVKTSKEARKLVDFDLLVPAGTAIQNARTSFIGDNMCRDGYHLDLNIGRYTASCVWFEAIFKQSVLGNTYIPEKVSAKEAAAGQMAAHKAVKRPFKVTELKKFK